MTQTEKSRAWRVLNPEKTIAISRKSARKRHATKSWIIWSFLSPVCRACGWNAFPEGLELHHTEPHRKNPKLKNHGGVCNLPFDELEEELRHVVPLCATCHAGVEAGRTTLTPEQARTLA